VQFVVEQRFFCKKTTRFFHHKLIGTILTSNQGYRDTESDPSLTSARNYYAKILFSMSKYFVIVEIIILV
jgi:hypothetical protein